MSVAKSGFDPAWLAHSALPLVDMNRSHLDNRQRSVSNSR
jgi:hypothetical protein